MNAVRSLFLFQSGFGEKKNTQYNINIYIEGYNLQKLLVTRALLFPLGSLKIPQKLSKNMKSDDGFVYFHFGKIVKPT